MTNRWGSKEGAQTVCRSMRRSLAALVALTMFAGLWIQPGGLPSAMSVTPVPEIEVTIAADPVSNNLDLTGFADLLKAKLNATCGIPTDKVHVNAVQSAAVSGSFNWYRFDHTNNVSLAESTSTSLVTYYNENYSNLCHDYHIISSGSGSQIDFYGYGAPAYKDFLFAPNGTANNKIFQFTIDEANTSYHSGEGAGFLFNTKYTYVGPSDRRLTGYLVLLTQFNVRLYRLDNVEIGGLSGGSYSGVTLLQQTAKPGTSSGTLRYLKLVASPTTVSFYQFTSSTYSTVQTKMIDNYTLPAVFNDFGFGPFASYLSHSCSQDTRFTFSNISMSEDTSVSFTDLVKSTNWNYPGSLRIIANLDNDGVPDFGVTSSLSTILYYVMQNNAHYVGWGINNTISIGGYTSVMDQANGFIARNSGKGTFINRSDAALFTLDQGTTALAAYICGQRSLMAGIDKPIINTQFPGGGIVTFLTPDTHTSLGNLISLYQWKHMDVATGTWVDEPGSTSSKSFTFGAGTYNFVSLRIQDSVTLQWSDYAIGYAANDTNAPPIAQFSLDTNELMPDTAVISLRTGTAVTATDTSYHPAGEALTDWEWKVYNATLVEQVGLAKTYTDSTKPAVLIFDFAGMPGGLYTIKLRVRKGEGEWSARFSQTVTVYKEGNTITITPVLGTIVYEGMAPLTFNIVSTTNNIAAYRIIKSPLGGGDNVVGDWTGTAAVNIDGTGSVSGGSFDVFVQARDTAGSSKTQLIGRYTLAYGSMVTVNAGPHGTVTPGTGMLPYNTAQTYIIKPEAGYLIEAIVLDGAQIVEASNKLGFTLTLTSVTAPHAITATFSRQADVLPPTITLPKFGTERGVMLWIDGPVQTFTVCTSPFPLQFTLEDDGGYAKWTIKVNGTVVVDPVGIGLITYMLSLTEGRNDVEIIATDGAGNWANQKLTIYLDSMMPALSVDALPFPISSSVLSITGSAVDAGSGLKSLTINGIPVVPFLDGSFSEKLALVRGANSILVEATDKAGNTSSQTFTVTYGTSSTTAPSSLYVVLTIGSADMQVNGMTQKMDAAPFIKDSRTLLPIRALIEALGGSVEWNASTKTATVMLGSRTVALTIGSKTALVDGKPVALDVAPMIVKGRTFLPLRAVAENLGLDLAWEPISRTISLTYWP
ncbi:stalk domain-containing protein [Candidatus Cryosericum terrychapinii]|nr:stalk domain-containing protein [Candidatus Cryosericum terrychapinii]